MPGSDPYYGRLIPSSLLRSRPLVISSLFFLLRRPFRCPPPQTTPTLIPHTLPSRRPISTQSDRKTDPNILRLLPATIAILVSAAHPRCPRRIRFVVVLALSHPVANQSHSPVAFLLAIATCNTSIPKRDLAIATFHNTARIIENATTVGAVLRPVASATTVCSLHLATLQPSPALNPDRNRKPHQLLPQPTHHAFITNSQRADPRFKRSPPFTATCQRA